MSSWPIGAWEESRLAPLWLDSAERPAPRGFLAGDVDADLLVVGGGFTGLWTALRALERDPGLRVVLVEGQRIAEEASGRNGGFCEASLTHGEPNGRARWPEEYEQIETLGLENLDGIESTLARYGIDCGFTRASLLSVATTGHQVSSLEPGTSGYLDAAATRAIVDSPTYQGGRLHTGGLALLDPARLAWGLARAAESLGATLHEGSPVTSLERDGEAMLARCPAGTVRARQVVLATNAFPSLVRRLRYRTVPVYDHVLATEPLTGTQLATLGWDPAIGVADSGNQFHYYRLTPDHRILWGGYDAIYHYGRSISDTHHDRTSSYQMLAGHFADTFPQLDGIRFTHRWAGVIDTSTRFCAFYGTTHAGRTAYAAGFTGLGVGATRFAADTMLDLLERADTPRTRLRMVRQKGIPFPPEPIAWAGIRVTKWALAREDRTANRGPWLTLLDRLGMGFDS